MKTYAMYNESGEECYVNPENHWPYGRAKANSVEEAMLDLLDICEAFTDDEAWTFKTHGNEIIIREFGEERGRLTVKEVKE